MSEKWIKRRINEFYYRKARGEGYRSRAVYKLLQIDEEFDILSGARVVLDLGAYPGSWSQYVRRVLPSSIVYAVDIVKMKKIDGVTFIRGDFNDENFRNYLAEKILNECGQVDVILSDMSPKLSGKHSYDHARSVDLAEKVLEFSQKILRNGGNAVVKVFDGDMLKETVSKYEAYFYFVKLRKPRASIKSSSELYIVAKDFKFSIKPSRRSNSTTTNG